MPTKANDEKTNKIHSTLGIKVALGYEQKLLDTCEIREKEVHGGER